MFTDLNIKFPSKCIKNCCKTNDTSISLTELEKENPLILNDEYMRRKSSMLFENILPEHGCDTCIQTEPNSLFRSWNRWNNELDNNEKNKIYTSDNLTTYEFVLSSSCDLKCVYCAPKDSSSWAKELGVTVNKTDSEWEDKVLEQLYKHLETKKFLDQEYYFFFSGGEPTYNPKTIIMIKKMLEYIPLDRSKIILSTNVNTKKAVFDKYLDLIEKHPNVKWIFDCSIDGIYERCEAIRYGISWDVAISNIKKLLTYENVDVRISPTVNLYSVPTMEEFVDYFIELFENHKKLHKYIFNFNMVQEPDLTPMSMPVQYKKYLDAPIQKCQQRGINFSEHLTNVQKLIGTKIDSQTAKKVKNKFNYFKLKRPNVDWDNLFPHVKLILEELEKNDANIRES